MSNKTEKSRVRACIALVLAGGLAAATAMPASAATPAGTTPEPASKQETTGVASGFVIGAAAGGPVGAIFGAAAGGWLGDRYHRKELERQSLASTLGDSEAQRLRLGKEMQRMNSTLAESEARSTRFGATVELTHELETTVHFRTGESELRGDSVAALRKLGAVLASLPDARARVAGFADARGSEEFNLELSKQRAATVAAELAAAGVDPQRLVVEAHGKELATAPETDIDGNAFERRVTVTLERAEPRVARAE